MNNLNDLEDQPAGNIMVSGQVSKPPAHLIKEIGEAALTAAE